MFSSFIQAGYECSTHILKSGKRLDLIASTEHDRFIKQDYERLLQMGIRTAREGLRWHLIEKSPSRYDFSSLVPIIEAANETGVQVIWDLFHFGWPDYLDIFSVGWVGSFAALAFEFAKLWPSVSGEMPAFVAPVNEISFFSWAAGDIGILNPFAHGRGAEMKQQLVRAALAAVRVLRRELPGVTIISPEPVIHIIGDPAIPGDQESAEAYRRSMFEAWDMLTGRLHPELGGAPDDLDVIGVNYYDRNQWWNYGKTIRLGDPQYRPFHQILKEVSDRYRLPMFIAETGTEDAARPSWFRYIAEQARQAIAIGVPLHGLCLYPILNHPGWEDDRHCFNGLWDYAAQDGSRPIYQPLADEICKQQIQRKKQDKEHGND